MTTADNVLDGNKVPGSETETRVYQAAYDLYQQAPDWIVFYRKVLGLDGLVREAYPEQKTRAAFERSPAYAGILEMLTKLRQRHRPAPTHEEPIRVITVRLPESLHNTLQDEAYAHRTSINQLCISKLLRFIEDELIPNRR